MREPRPVFQLHAVGQHYFAEQNGMFDKKLISSKIVFTSRDAAEKYREEFKRLVTSPLHDGDEGYLVDDGALRISLLELELHDGI